MKIIKTLLLLFCMLSMSSVALGATWTVGQSPSNASVDKAAKITNDRGDTLYLWLGTQNGSVELYGELQLGPEKTFSNKTPRYQIDQGMIIKLNRIPLEPFKSTEGWLRVTDKMATWKLYTGGDKRITQDEPFYNWLTGNRIRFIYFDINGMEKTTEFSLNGSSKAIAKVSGVKGE